MQLFQFSLLLVSSFYTSHAFAQAPSGSAQTVGSDHQKGTLAAPGEGLQNRRVVSKPKEDKKDKASSLPAPNKTTTKATKAVKPPPSSKPKLSKASKKPQQSCYQLNHFCAYPHWDCSNLNKKEANFDGCSNPIFLGWSKTRTGINK